jgi:dTDP-4-amino-4,6-dideoxygalactose transaminase
MAKKNIRKTNPVAKYKVRYVNPQKQYQDHKKEFLKTVDGVFSRGDLIMRKDLEDFEKKIAGMVGVKHAIGVNSGTDALSLSMEAAGIKEGDEVIVSGYTVMMSVSAIVHQKATPVLVDCQSDYNIDPGEIEKAITPKTKAIEVVHMHGRVCDMDRIMEIAKNHKLIVIEDAARALGAKYKTENGQWKMAGSFGLSGCFSMYPFKVLGAFGDAGAITTNDDETARKLRMLRYNGEDRETRVFYAHGRTALMDNLQAALLNVKIKYFPGWLARRRQIAKVYHKGLAGIDGVSIPKFEDSRYKDCWQNYGIRAQRRDELVDYLDKNGIEVLTEWKIPAHRQPVMMPNNISLPVTESICAESVLLPMYPELNDSQIEYVCKTLRRFYDCVPGITRVAGKKISRR